MSVIEVKATRAPATDPAEPYAIESTKKQAEAKTPYFVAIVLMGIVAYVKSMFSSSARTPDDPWQQEPEEEQALAHEGIGEAILDLAGQPQDAPQDLPADETGANAAGSGGRLITLQAPAEFIQIDAQEFDFSAFATGGMVSFRPAPPPWRGFAANDNRSASPAGGGVSAPTDEANDLDDMDEPDEPDDPSDPQNPDDPDSDGPDVPGEDDDDEENPILENRAPRTTGPVYLMDMTGCAMLVIAMSDLLQNATDPDGDTLTVTNLTVSSGSIIQSGDGWLYQPAAQFLGPVTITCEITDGEFALVQTAHFEVVAVMTLEGSDNDDAIEGTECADEIDGGAGNDRIDALSGDDIVLGGDGDDVICGGDGDDTLQGGAGDDVLHGGSGRDILTGGFGNDLLFGDGGDDILFGNEGDDVLAGGEGSDLLLGGLGNDQLFGDGGNDRLFGDDGNDLLSGGLGNDLLSGEGGDDTLFGDEGDDVLAGGEGRDILLGGLGNDQLSGDEGDDRLFGEAGDDLLSGGQGIDVLDGGDGNDELDGGEGNDVLSDGAGSDIVDGGAGDDRVIAAADGEDDEFAGGEGCDTLDYSATSEGVTIDTVAGQACASEIGTDTISGFESYVGGSGADHFIAGDSPTILAGGGGDDVFEFLAPVVSIGSSETPTSVTHAIVDFEPGDIARMSNWDIFEETMDRLEDDMEKIYGDDFDAEEVPIRFRHDQYEDFTQTVIEADLDLDGHYETTVTLDGYHAIVITEHC